MVPNEVLHILTINTCISSEPLKRGQPLDKGLEVRSQGVPYMEVPYNEHYNYFNYFLLYQVETQFH